MSLHLIKLCVGVSEVEELRQWVAEAAESGVARDHVTRMFPKKREELLAGGSLFWVMRGMIMCRQPIADLQELVDAEGTHRCRIVFESRVIAVRPTPRRAFQGWRYLVADDAPPDLKSGQMSPDAMPEAMRRELAALALI
jgi:hypothetical protein